MATVQERFEAKVEERAGHLIWTGSCDTAGTPQFRVAGRLTTARRIAWELHHGTVSAAVLVMACPAEPRCVNVEHLRSEPRPRSFRDVLAEVEERRQRNSSALPAELTPDVSVNAAPALNTEADPVDVDAPSDSDERPTGVATARRRKGSGSLEEREPGVWKIVATGHHGRFSHTVKGNRADAEAELVVLNARTPGSQRLFSDLVDAHIVLLERSRRSPATLRRYRDVWANWLADRVGHVPIEDVTPPLLQDAVDAMAEARQSEGSINQALSLISGALTLAVRHGHIDTNPITLISLPNGRQRARPRQGPRPN